MVRIELASHKQLFNINHANDSLKPSCADKRGEQRIQATSKMNKCEQSSRVS